MVKQSDPYSNFNTFDGDFYIGSNAYADQISWLSNFKGTIDDLRLYNSAIKEWGMEYLYDQKAFQKVHSGINKNAQNIMGHWKFDGNQIIHKQNDENLIGVEWSLAMRVICICFYLNGIADHVIVPHDDSLNAVDQLSVSMWLKIESFSNIWSAVFKGS